MCPGVQDLTEGVAGLAGPWKIGISRYFSLWKLEKCAPGIYRGWLGWLSWLGWWAGWPLENICFSLIFYFKEFLQTWYRKITNKTFGLYEILQFFFKSIKMVPSDFAKFLLVFSCCPLRLNFLSAQRRSLWAPSRDRNSEAGCLTGGPAWWAVKPAASWVPARRESIFAVSKMKIK